MPVLKNPDLGALLQSGQTPDLLALNSVLDGRGLSLTPANAEDILESRKRTLKNQGRIELDTKVTQKIIQRLSESSYINRDNFISSIDDLYEIFHHIKNEISEFTSDEEILDAIMFSFENICGGSTELLMGKGAEAIVHKFREKSDSAGDEKNEEE